MEKKSIIFCGTPAFAVPSLKALVADAAFDVRLVVTQPDRPVGRAQKVTPSPVKVAAEELGLPILQPEKINDPSFLSSLAAHRPDFLVVVAYGQILSKEVLAVPKVAAVNVHGSLLPRWRGASPVEHAILAGDDETGVTVQIMAEALDAGPILSAQSTSIGPQETAPELRERLSALGASLLVQTLQAPLHPVPQPEDGVTYCKKLAREDGMVDPLLLTAEEIERRVRALVPWPGVTISLSDQTIKILAVSLMPSPGSIALPCRQGTVLHLVQVQPANGKPMTAQEWMRGRR